MRRDVLENVRRQIRAEAEWLPKREKKRLGCHHCVAVQNWILSEPNLFSFKRPSTATVIEVARVNVECDGVAVEDE